MALLAFTSALAIAGWLPAEAQEASGPQAGANSDVVVITGRRLSQADEAIGVDKASATVAVTRDALLSAPAGISGLKMLESLPGFNVQTDGALGLYEFGNSVTVRAFNLAQIGFVLDGIPMGRSDAFGGSPIFRYVDNENLGAVIASPGAGDVSQPSYASLGPVVEYKSIDPSDEFGGVVSQAFGDFNLNRSFIKLETGNIRGFSAYASRSKTNSDLWRGGGSIDREHIEGKMKFAWDSDTYVSFKYVSNDFHDYDSPTMSKAQYESGAPCGNGMGGRDCGYSATLPPGTLGNVADYNVPGYTYAAATNWYLDRVNIRNDSLYGGAFTTNIGEAAHVTATAYYEDKDGYGVSPEGYSSVRARYEAEAAAGLPVTAPRGVEYGLSGVGGFRKGVVLKGDYEIANNELEAGVWLETDDYHRTQKRLNHEGGVQSGAVLYDEVTYFRRDYTSTRDTTQIFLKDTISLLADKLKVELGVKSLSIDYQLSGYRDYNDYYATVATVPTGGWGPQTVGTKFKDHFLPMVGVVYQITPTEQLFTSYAENFALPRGADDVFSIAPNNVVATPAPEGEKSKNFEVGARTLRGNFDGAVSVYYTQFDNRIEPYSSALPGQTGATETYYQNVGGVKAYGVELTGAWKPYFLHNYAYFNGAVTYNHSEFQDDQPNLPIAGKLLPDSPEWAVQAGVTVEPTSWIVGNLSAKYTGKRYSTYTNSESVKGFTIVSGYVDFGDGMGVGPLKNVKLRVNVDNIFDEDTLAFIFPQPDGIGFFRPQSPRTFSMSITGVF
ncbi:MAG: TonB-dependent receptor [Alphaproteobacteria bacterium]|nr:TonB-dependent receptor [Alphaproteobacteria bacterium]